MNKQPISVTLSPDNLLWLKGRARAVAVGSLSEFLDHLITRARCGQDTPRPVRSMKGALAGLGPEPDFDHAELSADIQKALREKWDGLLAEFEGATLVKPPIGVGANAARQAIAVAERGPAFGKRSHHG
ncbi:MAG: hypothetical protein WCP29_17275 [Acidobacteriota bacterium]